MLMFCVLGMLCYSCGNGILSLLDEGIACVCVSALDSYEESNTTAHNHVNNSATGLDRFDI